MANEITAAASLSAAKGGVSVGSGGSQTDTADMAGDQMLANVQIIGTAAEQILLGDITTVGYVFLKNLDATNYIEIALDSGVTTQIFAKLLAGDVTLVKAATATLYAKANSANCNLHVVAVEL